MSKIDAALAAQKFAHQDVAVCLNGELNTARDKLHAELVQATKARGEDAANDTRLGSSPVAALQKKVAALEQEMLAATITLRITAVPYGEYNKFVIQNPPRKNNAGDAKWGFNTQEFFTFVTKRTAKSVEDDGTLEDITDEQWTKIIASLTDGDHDRIGAAVIEVNRLQGARGVDFLSRG